MTGAAGAASRGHLAARGLDLRHHAPHDCVKASRGVATTTIDDVRVIVAGLPRSHEAFVRGRVKFRVGRIVYLAFSTDESQLGFAFPKEERDAMLSSAPGTFVRPIPSDLRYNWLEVRLDAIDRDELEELVLDAWRMVVPKSVATAHLGP